MKTGFVLTMLAALLVLGLSQAAKADCAACVSCGMTQVNQQAVYDNTNALQDEMATANQPPFESALPVPDEMALFDQQENMGMAPGPDDYGVMPTAMLAYAAGVPAPTPATCGVAPFSGPMHYLSQAGYLRWQHFQTTGTWETPHQALAAAHTERMLCAMR
ncbi:MAG TPA: hypothetical protein VGM23_05505 [Armatimonadota bacterium]|jgi:hypothetical protein